MDPESQEGSKKGGKKWTHTEYLQRGRRHAGTFTQATSFNSHEDT